MPGQNSRRWVFTLHIGEGDPPTIWNPTYLTYLKYQIERAPTTGARHLQGCMISKQARSLGALKRDLGLPAMHLEIARAWEQAKDYAGKEETRVEGPWELGYDQQGRRSDLEAPLAMVKAGKRDREIADEHPVVFAKMYRGLAAVRAATTRPWAGRRQVAVFWGATGTGKSRTVDRYTAEEELYRVLDLKKGWFDGYQGEATVLFDECGAETVPPIDVMKQLLDVYGMRVQVKGGSACWNARRIVLCSNNPIEMWYPLASDADMEALKRRVEVFHFPSEARKARRWMLQPLPDETRRGPIPDDSDSEYEARPPSPVRRPPTMGRTWSLQSPVEVTQVDDESPVRLLERAEAVCDFPCDLYDMD